MANYYFNLPPITALTIPQQGALYETRPIALSGGPGTGKSVVSLWRHINNYQRQNSKRSLLLTYTTTLRQYLKASCMSQNASAAYNVGTSYRNKPQNKWDEIIIDEAQDLGIDYYQSIMHLGEISYGADDSQILYRGHCSEQSQLASLFPNNISHVLDRNFRSTQRIMQFAKQVFPQANILQRTIDQLSNNIGELPVFLVSYTEEQQNNAIYDIINAFNADYHNIAILLPLKSNVSFYEEVLNARNYNFSVYYEDKQRFPKGCESIKNIHLTTFKSAKGLEFDTVIMPDFQNYNEMPGQLNIIKWNDFYVACTRARSNLYLISKYDMPQLNGVTDKQIL